MALAGAWCAAGYLIIGRQVRSSISLLSYTFVVYGTAALVLLGMVVLVGQSLTGISADVVGWCLLLALFRFNRQSLELLRGEDYDLELGQYLDRNRYSREFIEHVGEVVAVLDAHWNEERRQTDGVLGVNWHKRRTIFDFDKVEMSVDYGWVIINAQRYLLPVKSEVLACQTHSFSCMRNSIEYRNYRKFAVESQLLQVESEITFEGEEKDKGKTTPPSITPEPPKTAPAKKK